MNRQHVICVYTGNGKGKTSAGLGMIFRAVGHGHTCGVVQFIKHNPESWGEYKTAKRLGVAWENFGCGFTWEQKEQDASIAEAKAGWDLAREWILSGVYQLVLLDELSYVLSYGWIDPLEVVRWFDDHRDVLPNIVITGRNMPEVVVEYADTVSEIQEIKHHYVSRGIPAQKGIEF